MVEKLLEPIERMEALDSPADAVAGFVGKVLPAGPVKDALSGTQLGHPVHPILTDVAIGSWTSSLFLDLFGGEGARDAADALLGLGLAAALPTAVTGLSDWADTWGKARRIGLVHAGLNVTAVACFTGSLLRRWRGSRATGVVLSAVGAGVMTLGAYLGGHLSFRKGVGVDETTFDEGPAEWTDVAALEDVPEGTPVTGSAGGVTLLLYRSGDRVHAIDNRCSHRGGPLNEGTCDGQTVTCPWHGSIFRLSDGSIVRGPAVAKQPSYDVRITDGRVEVRRNPEELHA
ncbi:MAG TPA: Rieske 2Fe-2S domain-containing protein [Actinomycetota bacterium]|jgi:nitrite reductase/ring-hydroxylating ferredoxin subunit/uncharacterized membrane protein